MSSPSGRRAVTVVALALGAVVLVGCSTTGPPSSSHPAPGGSTGATGSGGTVPAPDPVTASASAGMDPSGGSTGATDQVVLAPVGADGRPSQGWSVTSDESAELEVTCPDGQSAVSARSDNVHYCYPSAATADTCWAADRPTVVLCLVDPFTRGLTAFRITAAPGRAQAPPHPRPLGLQLTDGDHCRLRDGGAWGTPDGHPDWTGFYTCTSGKAVWAAAGSSGMDTSHPVWTVQVGGESGALRPVAVRTALFVGAAT